MKALRFVLLGLAVAVLGLLSWRLVQPGMNQSTVTAVAPSRPTGAPRPDATAAKALVMSRMTDADEYKPFFDRLQAEFPAEYASLVAKATAATARSGHPPNPERLLTDALRELRQARGVLAAKAETEPLGEIFSAQSAMLDTLAAQDPTLCTDFLYGGLSPSFMAFSATHRALLERTAMATLNAIANGRAKQIARDAPTPTDFDQLAAALKSQNLSDNQVAALLDGKTFDPPLPDIQLCDAGRAYLHVLATMPDDLRQRVYGLSAQLLARS